MINIMPVIIFKGFLNFSDSPYLNSICVAGGIIKRARMHAAANVKVLVNARGLNNFPSEYCNIKTGRKLTIVVATDVRIAPDTSLEAS